jgi:hypothetical protein
MCELTIKRKKRSTSTIRRITRRTRKLWKVDSSDWYRSPRRRKVLGFSTFGRRRVWSEATAY